MHGITRFNANGQTFDIPETETPNFLKDAPNAQRTRRFTAGGNTYDIPDGEAEAFLKDAPDAVETRTIGYRGADGTDQTVDVPLADLPKFLRRYNADETFAHDRERTRKNIAAQLPKPTDETPLWASVKAFGEGLARSVTDSANLWRETYGDGPVTDALLGANANANKIVNGILGIPEDIESVASMAAGGENTDAGKWLKEDAKAGRAYLESLHPTRISEAVGREDWGTIAGDKIGDISATIIKFAAGDKDPTKLFNPLVVSSAAADSYAQTYDNAIAHGKSVEDANYLANGSAVWNALMTMFMMRAFKGEAQAVSRDLGTGAKAVIKREATQMAKTGNVMGVQTAGNKAIETNAEGRNATGKELATAYSEGLGEGALFHSVNALGAQISEYGHNAERRAEWVNEFRDHILNSQSDREMYLKTPMGDPMRAICESVQNGTLPDRKAFVSAGIPKELCKTEAQRREIAQNFIETIGITADARNARAAQNILDIANAMGEGDPIALNAYREWRDIIEANSVPKDVRLWNGKKIVAERVDMGDGKFGYDIYHDAGDGTRQLITTSDEPLLLDAYADAKTDMMNYFGLEAPKKPGLTAEPRKLREQIEDTVKPTEPAKDTKNEEPTADHPQTVDEPVSGEPAPAEAGKRDEGVAAGDGADAASPRGTAEAVAAPSAEATLERGAQDALAAALEAVKPTAKKRPGKVAAKTEEQSATPNGMTPREQNEATPTESAWGTVTENAEANRLQVDFGGTKPPQDIIDLMKHNGFKWSPKNGVWQRQLTDNARRTMERIKPELDKLFGVDADKAAKAEAFNAPAFEVGANGEKVAIGPKAEPAAEPAPVAPKRRPGKKAEAAVKRTAPDTTALRDEIAKAKQAKGGGTHEVTIGTTTIKFNNTKESIAVAEKMLKKLETVKDWSYKEPSNSVPSEPKPLTVASGKKVGGFKDVSPDFFGGKNEHREVLKKPIIKDGYIYATDGRMMIRMKNDGIAKDTESQIDVSKAYSEAEKLPVFEAFKMDVSKENIALEQAKSALTKDVENPFVELWRAPDGKIVMRSRNTEDTEPSSTAFVNVDSLADHDFIGSYKPDHLTKVFKTFTKLGAKDVDVTWNGPDKALRLSGGGADVLIMPMRLGNPGWTDTKVQLFGGRRRMTDAERAQAVDAYIKSEQEYAKQNDPNITKAALNKIESDIRRSEANNQALIAKHNGKLDPLYSRRGPTVDAAKLDDPAFREWSQKRGTKADDAEALARDRVSYDLDQAMDAAKRTGNWIGVKVVRETNADAMPTANAKPIKDGGQVVGWYDPTTKEVHLKPGADAKTVAHEVGWHATYDWAKANHPTLAKTMEQYAANAPEALKAEIKKLYGRDLTPAELIDEIGAGRFEREHGKKLQKLLADRANRKWYAKVWDGIKDAYKAVLTKLGFNRVDLDEALKDKTPEQAMDFLASAMARGKALGKMRPGKAREGARPMAAITPVPSPSGTGLFVDPQTKLRGRFIGFRIGGSAKLGFGWGEQWLREGKYHNIALRKLDERLGRWTDGRPTDDSLFMHRVNQEGFKKAAMDRSEFYENAIGKLMKEHGFGVNEVDAYLHYRGSPERNALVERRDGKPNGSGESDQHWADVWNAVVTKYGPEAQYIKQAAHIAWAMQDEGLASRLYSGRMSWDHYDTLKQNEPHHIPHKKDLSELDPELYSTSGGKGIRRNEFMSAHGTDGSDSPLVFMFREFRDAELGSRENEWRIRLADAVRQNPDLGHIRSAQRMENGLVQLNGDVGRGLKLEQKKEMHHEKDGGDPNLILFKEGGELKAIELNGDFGSDIADAVTGRSIADFSNEGIKKLSRLYANTATSWSPTFGFGNFAKDKVEIGLHNVGDFGYGRLATIPKGFIEAAGDMTGTSSMMREMKRYIKERSFDTTTADGRLLKEFVEAGGQIGGAASEGFQDTLKRFDKFNIASKQCKIKAMWETFQNFNERMEMINRLRNFKTARDHGMSPEQAAFKSRQDSTDFNAFGRQKWMNTVWNFSNSVTGGTLASLLRFTKGASSKRVIGTLAGLGVLEALTEYMLNGNEEEEELEGKSIGKDMSEYERANAIVVRKGEHFFRIPIHVGPYSIVKYAFNGATRVALGLMDAKEYAKNLASEVRDTAKHFTGTGDVAGGDEEDLPILNALGAPDIGQSFAPSMLQPVVQIKEKKTFSGAPMESYMQPNDPEPKAWNGRKDTEVGYKWMAQAQNALTGGDQHLKGHADNSPEVFKAAFEGVFKNTGKDAMQTFDVLKNLSTGHLPEIRNIPVVNRFVRKVQPNDRRYYEALKKYKAIVNKATKEEDAEEAKRWVLQHPSGDSSVDKRGARMATELDNLIKNVEFYKKQSQGYEPILTGEMSPSGVPQVARWEPVELTREVKEAIDADLRRAQAEFIVTFRKYETDGE